MSIREFDALESTNTFLKNEAQTGVIPHGETVVAHTQTGGRGRLGRSFFSEGGVYFSVYLDAAMIACPFSAVTCAVAVAVARALKSLSVDVSIKWVNDLLFEGKKLCGILCEAVTLPDGYMKGVVVGVGINYCSEAIALPPELSKIACVLQGTVEDQKLLLQRCVANITEIVQTKFGWMEYYRSNSAVLGKTIRVIPFGAPVYMARAVDVDEDGALLLRREDGCTECLTSGEVSVRIV